MTPVQKVHHAERMLEHSAQQYARSQRVHVEWVQERQQWIAHYVGKPAITGYGRAPGEAIDMLKGRTK